MTNQCKRCSIYPDICHGNKPNCKINKENKMDNEHIEQYISLASAIVGSAIAEYRTAYRKYVNKYKRNEPIRLKQDAGITLEPEEIYSLKRERDYAYKIIDLERFFHSQWCYELCGVSGDVLIREARKRGK